MVSEVGGGVLIGEGEDEPTKVDVQMRRQCRRRHKRAPPRVPAISPCRRVGEEEEAGEVDADVEVEARSRQVVGDAISISDRAKQKRYTAANRVEPRGARSRRSTLSLILFLLLTRLRERQKKKTEG